MADETAQQSQDEPREEFFENTGTNVEVEDVGGSVDRGISDEELDRLSGDFDNAMNAAVVVFGDDAFRKHHSNWSKRRGPINRALFDSWAVALADYRPHQLEPRKKAIMAAARKRMGEYEYHAAISQGTGDPSKVRLRFEAARKILKEATA